MNTLPPGLRGLLAQRQMAQQEQQGQLGQIQGLLGIQQAQMQQGLLSQQMQDKRQQRAQIEQYAGTLPESERAAFMIDPSGFLKRNTEEYTLTPGAVRFRNGQQVAAAPVREQNQSNLSRLMAERSALQPGDPRIATYDNAIRKESEVAGQIVPKINVNAGTPYFQPIQTANGVMAFNSRTGQMEPVRVNGSPVVGAQADPRLQGQITGAKETAKAGVEQSEEVRKSNKRIDQLSTAIGEAEKLLSSNPTGSYMGAAADVAGRIAGISTNSAQNAAKLETLAGWLVSNVPRMEGPQSNIDVQNYQTMAAKVGDRTVPVKERQAALATLKGLQEKYKALNQPQSSIDDLLNKYK
jgi:hypothetical protein